jgi:serine protease AprX
MAAVCLCLGPMVAVRAVADEVIEPYDDVRYFPWGSVVKKDVSTASSDQVKPLIPTLWFNQDTHWPSGCKPDADRAMEAARNPGLGVRALHKQGITGKGVNVAIIDQPLFDDHPEFAGKFAAYKNLCPNPESDSSMHGPAVMSLLVGETIGTAPGAKVYFAAAPSWTGDAAYYAQALDWILEENAKLPAGSKIRVVSVSAAPSGRGSPFDKNNDNWDKAVARAEKAGILILDCSNNAQGFIGPAYFVGEDREDPAKLKPGFPGRSEEGSWQASSREILVPSSPRTTAEQNAKGEFKYQYTGRGGSSWTIPYAAGVLAMGWQLKPDLAKDEIVDLLLKSAYVDANGVQFINPPKFIEMVRKSK